MLSPDCALAIATGEQRIYANVLLAVGVVPPGGGAGRAGHPFHSERQGT